MYMNFHVGDTCPSAATRLQAGSRQWYDITKRKNNNEQENN